MNAQCFYRRKRRKRKKYTHNDNTHYIWQSFDNWNDDLPILSNNRMALIYSLAWISIQTID